MNAPRRSSFKALLQHARAGESDAWQEIFSRLANQEKEGAELMALARRLLPRNDRARDFVDSMDVMQSALRSGWLDASQFRGESEAEFFQWLRTILRRKIGRAVRRKKPQIGMNDAAERAVDDAAPAVEEVVRDEMKQRLRDAIAQLPEEQRLVIELRFAGKKSPEIAAELGITATAVRMRESRAARKLKAVLRQA